MRPTMSRVETENRDDAAQENTHAVQNASRCFDSMLKSGPLGAGLPIDPFETKVDDNPLLLHLRHIARAGAFGQAKQSRV